jgi:hypothetical protein
MPDVSATARLAVMLLSSVQAPCCCCRCVLQVTELELIGMQMLPTEAREEMLVQVHCLR